MQRLDVMVSVFIRRAGRFHAAAVHDQKQQYVDRAMAYVLELLLFNRAGNRPADRLVTLLQCAVEHLHCAVTRWHAQALLGRPGDEPAGGLRRNIGFWPAVNRFEPLAKSDPALVLRLEQVVARGGLAIPPERMFLMKASAKSTQKIASPSALLSRKPSSSPGGTGVGSVLAGNASTSARHASA